MYIINSDNGQSYEDHSNEVVGLATSLKNAIKIAVEYPRSRGAFMEIRKAEPNTTKLIAVGYVDSKGFRKVRPNEF